jgi:hypothetical protein
MKKFALEFDANGDLVLDATTLKAIGLPATSEPELIAVDGGTAILRDASAGGECRLFAGSMEVLDAGDIVGMVNNLKKSGILRFLDGDAQKALFFTKGEVVYATSTLADDRLGNTLWRNGMITLDALNEVTDQVGAGGARLGELLMKLGRLKPRDIYVGLTLQVKEIFLSTFSISGGTFAFTEGEHTERNAVRLHETTIELIMQGMRQHGELSRLRTIVPDKNHRFTRRLPPPGIQFNEREHAVLTLADGGKSFGDILVESQLGEFEGLKTMVRLIRMGVLAPVEAEAAGLGKFEDKVGILIEALRLCYQELENRGAMGMMHLESYVQDPPAYQELLGGLSFDADGMLDQQALTSRAVTLYGNRAGEVLMDALDELLQYAMFEVKNALKPEEAKGIVEAVVHAFERARSE